MRRPATDHGCFRYWFPAHPDALVDDKDNPIFEFAVSADVTDTTGETCSAEQKVGVARTALRASLSAPEWLTDQKPVEITIATDRRRNASGRRADYYGYTTYDSPKSLSRQTFSTTTKSRGRPEIALSAGGRRLPTGPGPAVVMEARARLSPRRGSLPIPSGRAVYFRAARAAEPT